MSGKYRYFLMMMITFITIINYVDRSIMAYAQEYIINEYGLNAKSWGHVLGFFGYGYIFGGFFGGLLADKKGPKFVWMLSAVTWSIFALGMGVSGDIGIAVFGGSALAGFAVFRILFGLAEGPALVGNARTLANWAPVKERAFLNGIGILGVPFGALITAPIAVFLISTVGWKMMFVVLGAIGIIWAIIWRKIFTDYPEDHPLVSKEELEVIRYSNDIKKNEGGDKTISPWYHFLKSPTLMLNSIAHFCANYINFLILTWAPKYLQDVFNYDLKALGYLGMIPWALACITVLLGPKISDILFKRTNNLWIARSGLCMISFILTGLFFTLILTVNSPLVILLLMSLGTGSSFLGGALFWVVIQDTAPTRVGAYTGVNHFIINAAAIVAPTLTGYLVMTNGYPAMFIAAVVVCLIGFILMIFVKPGIKNNQSEVIVNNARM